MRDRDEDVQRHIAEYEPLSDAEVRQRMKTWKPNSPGFIAGEEIIQRRIEDRDPAKGILAKTELIEARLASVEQEARKPEARTWAFWIGIVGVVIALASMPARFWWQAETPAATQDSETAGSSDSEEALPKPQESTQQPQEESPSPQDQPDPEETKKD